MFNKLILSGPGQRSWLRNPTVVFGSIIVHLLALAAILWATREAEALPEPEPEQVTYIDITELPPPEPDEIYEAAPEPPPDQEDSPPPDPSAPTPPRAAPARAPAQPRTPQPSDDAATDEPAGFQELNVPDVDVSGIPEPDLSAPAVRAEDFGGRGAVGGKASGTPAATPPLPRETGGSRTGGGTGPGSGNTTYSANLVDEQAELRNRGDVARILSRRYPEQLRSAGVSGRVVVQFVVDRNGRVEPGSVKVISTSDPAFADATRQALQEFRFKPGKVQGQSVRQMVQIPVTWNLDR